MSIRYILESLCTLYIMSRKNISYSCISTKCHIKIGIVLFIIYGKLEIFDNSDCLTLIDLLCVS